MKKITLIWTIVALASHLQAAPPYHGTIYVDPDIITPEDPTSFKQLSEAGNGCRKMFDRRCNKFITLNAHLFTASFYDQKDTIEVQVNPEFDARSAFEEAHRYLKVIGQLHLVLRKDVKTVWIHKGNCAFGGGNNNLLIHTDRGMEYVAQGVLAETLVHEAAHTSLDAMHASNNNWIAAQDNDQGFISTYAEKNPAREDLAESFLMYLALRYRPDRIDEQTKARIKKTMPNRIAYFDHAKLEMHPLKMAQKENAQ